MELAAQELKLVLPEHRALRAIVWHLPSAIFTQNSVILGVFETMACSVPPA